MQKIFERFMSEEEGNALVDWTVLMAGLVLMAASVLLTITGGIDTASTDQLEHAEELAEPRPA